jgi:predicted component of type VI protein secretion system
MPASGRLPDRLVVLIGPGQGSELPLEGDRFLIGRDEDCEFAIDHASVSRIHAEVRRLDADHFEIIDKGSANGLRINGQPRLRAMLDGRDVVELGDVVLKYIAKGQVFRASEAEGRRIAAFSGSPPPETAPRGRLSPLSTIGAAAAGAVVVALVLLLLTPGRSAPQPSGEGPQQTLERAVALHAAGDVLGAHALLVGISTSSQARTTAEFIAVETAWAKAMMERAARTSDAAERRALLDEVSKSPSVPAAEREAALSALQRSAAAGLALDEIE